ncbi:MAG: glycosyltransferase family A protein, partial [Desulfovibrionaceae bacterium]|nr:glycosyltransferase family A protein [Desulfovibrionaceae bacterium]
MISFARRVGVTRPSAFCLAGKGRIVLHGGGAVTPHSPSKRSNLSDEVKSKAQMITPIKFSVIVTSYNYEKYIKDTIESLIGQSVNAYEIIVVDDGSTDRSVDIINDYMMTNSNIKLYQHDGGINKGLCESVKLGIRKATGDYITFCESDGYWDVNHLKNLWYFILRNRNIDLI